MLPLVLLACLPPLGTPRGGALLQGRTCLAYAQEQAPALRGMLALVLRSVATKEGSANLCAGAVGDSRY